MPEQNITQLTPATATALAQTVRAVKNLPADRRAVANPYNVQAVSPHGRGQYKVYMILDDTDTPAKGFDYPRFYSADGD